MTKEKIKNYIQTADELDDKENNKILLSLYGWLSPIGIDNYDYSWTLMDDFPIGWRKSFGWEMINEIDEVVKKYNLTDFHPIQIKEKFGGLRFYTNHNLPEIYSIIEKYENLSYEICIECGKPAKWISTGWISPWCDSCKNKIRDNMVSVKEYYG